MSEHLDDVVKVASGSLVQVELWQQVLTEAGIRSNVVGTDLSAGIGSALPAAVELWVRREDLERATAALESAERETSFNDRLSGPHPIPKDEPLPKKPEGDHFPGTGRHDYGARGK